MTIVPDNKNWTWVIDRSCPECGFDSAAVERNDIASAVLANAAEWNVVLMDEARRRPSPFVWSPLEYGCHVRDVLRLYDARLALMLESDDPTYANWDQDATAVEERYGEQHPGSVARELLEAARTIAARFEVLLPGQWTRTGRRSDGASFTIDTFGRYFLHDIVHHLDDVRRPLSAPDEAPEGNGPV